MTTQNTTATFTASESFPTVEPHEPLFLRQAMFFGFFGFALIALNCLVDNTAIDITLIPRLLALLVFLLVAIAGAGVPRISRLLDGSVLSEPVIPLFGGYLIVTCGSLLVAVNASAGLTDVFRTLATFLMLCLSCLLLPLVPRWQEQFLKLGVAAGLIAVGVGCHEIITELGVGIHGRHAMEQITGLMSSVNLFAGMLVLMLPWCLCGVVLLRGFWRLLAAVVSGFLLALIFLLQSRAAWLAVLIGFGAAIGVLLLDSARFGLSRRARNSLGGICLAGLATLAGGIAIAPTDNPFAQRFRSIFVPPDDPAALPSEGGRLMIWGITSHMIADHPFTGVGAGNFTIRLHEYFGGDDLDFSNVHTNWIQPHNDFFWVFAEKGLLGILLFMGCLVAAGAAIRTILCRDAIANDRWLTLAACGALVSYITLSCFDFPLERITHQVSLAVLLAVITVIKHGVQPAAGSFFPTAPGRYVRLVAGALIVVALSLGIAYSLAALRQEKEVILARRAWREGQWDETLAAAQRAQTPWKTLDPLASPVAFLEGMAQLRLGRVEEAIEALERAQMQNPNRMYIINNLGMLYARTGRFDEAIECFSLAAQRYPHRIEPFNNLASCLIETGRFAEAVELLEQIPEEHRSAGIRHNLSLALEQAAAAAEAASEPATEPSF